MRSAVDPRAREGRNMRRRIGLVVAVAAVIAFTGCSSNAGGSGQGGVLRIGTSSGSARLNPFVGFNQDDYATWMYIYPTLRPVRHDDADLRLRAQLRAELGAVQGRPEAHLPHGAERDLVRRTAAHRRGCRVDDPDDQEVRSTDRPGAWANSVNTIMTIEAPDANTVVATYATADRDGAVRRRDDADPAAAGVGAVRDRRRQGHQDISRTSPRTASRSSAAARSSSPSTRRTTSRCSNATRTGTARRRTSTGSGSSSSATRTRWSPR